MNGEIERVDSDPIHVLLLQTKVFYRIEGMEEDVDEYVYLVRLDVHAATERGG